MPTSLGDAVHDPIPLTQVDDGAGGGRRDTAAAAAAGGLEDDGGDNTSDTFDTYAQLGPPIAHISVMSIPESGMSNSTYSHIPASSSSGRNQQPPSSLPGKRRGGSHKESFGTQSVNIPYNRSGSQKESVGSQSTGGGGFHRYKKSGARSSSNIYSKRDSGYGDHYSHGIGRAYSTANHISQPSSLRPKYLTEDDDEDDPPNMVYETTKLVHGRDRNNGGAKGESLGWMTNVAYLQVVIVLAITIGIIYFFRIRPLFGLDGGRDALADALLANQGVVCPGEDGCCYSWGEWGAWSMCDSCGGGEQSRQRTCQAHCGEKGLSTVSPEYCAELVGGSVQSVTQRRPCCQAINCSTTPLRDGMAMGAYGELLVLYRSRGDKGQGVWMCTDSLVEGSAMQWPTWCTEPDVSVQPAPNPRCTCGNVYATDLTVPSNTTIPPTFKPVYRATTFWTKLSCTPGTSQ